MDHVLEGDVKTFKNGMKQATGGHYLRNADLQVNEVLNAKDINGVFEGKISIRDPETGKWVPKPGRTSFYPEEWSKRRVAHEIEGAFRESKPVLNDNGKVIGWKGTSPSGLDIQDYYGKPEGSAATAWPIYQNRK